jgi:hypothetical protein
MKEEFAAGQGVAAPFAVQQDWTISDLECLDKGSVR